MIRVAYTAVTDIVQLKDLRSRSTYCTQNITYFCQKSRIHEGNHCGKYIIPLCHLHRPTLVVSVDVYPQMFTQTRAGRSKKVKRQVHSALESENCFHK